MTIELPPAQASKLNTLLKAGTFSSPAEVFAEGLRLIQEQQTGRAKAFATIWQQVLERVRQIRAGKVMLLEDALVADARGRQRLANSNWPGARGALERGPHHRTGADRPRPDLGLHRTKQSNGG